MDEDTLAKLSTFKNIEDFIKFITPYYPDLIIRDYTIEEIEISLTDFLIKLIGKIISISPENMRLFLKDYLLKYEIMNIKQIILGIVLGFSRQEKRKYVNFLVEEFLENTDFINKLVEYTALDELQLFFKGTKYYKEIREGILYFKTNKEIFVLEAFLDQLYYKNLLRKERIYSKEEKHFIFLFTSMITEIYNLNLIYRGILNNIDKTLLSQLLVNKFFFLDERKILFLLNSPSIEVFFENVSVLLAKPNKLNYQVDLYLDEHPLWILEKLYVKYFLKQLKIRKGNIQELTLFNIFEVLINKEEEIKLAILPTAIKILHEKFETLKGST